MIVLAEIKSGKNVVVHSVRGGHAAERRLVEMGLIPGELIKVLNNPGFGPVYILVKGSKIALGQGLANKILVKENENNG